MARSRHGGHDLKVADETASYACTGGSAEKPPPLCTLFFPEILQIS